MRLIVAIFMAALLWPAGAARADVITPDVAGCRGKKEGDPCGQGSACAKSRCGRLDYSKGVPPRSVVEDCLRCAPKAASGGTAAPPASASPGPTNAKPDTPAKKSSSCAAAPAGHSRPGVLFALLALAAVVLVAHRAARASSRSVS